MDRVRRRLSPAWLQLVGPGQSGSGQVSASSISPERQQQLQIALQRLDKAGKDVARLGPEIFTLVSETMPGKRLVRLDLLEPRGDRIFTSPRITTLDGSYAFAGSIEVTPVLQHDWDRLGVTGEPSFVASMQAMNTRKAVVRQEGGGRFFLAEPLLGAGNRTLGAMVMANQTADGMSLITPEDKEIFRAFASKVSELLDRKLSPK